MAISNQTVLELVNKSINRVDDLYKFYKYTIGQISYNLHLPSSGALFIFGAKS